MKRVWACSLVALAACSPPQINRQGAEAQRPHPAASTSATASATAPGASASASSGAEGRAVKEENGVYQFDYAYPAAAAAQSELAAWLDKDLAEKRAAIAADARGAKADSAKDGFPFNPYGSSTKWEVVTDLPGWLSLSAQVWEYTGGAHGNPGFDALLWDKAAKKRMSPLDLFTSKAALAAAIQPAFCDRLDAERAKRRQAPVNRASGDEFDQCIDPTGEVVILGSSDHAHFNRLGVLVGPYEAGPYAEGEYDVSLPVTTAVIAAVKPQYRALFAVGR